MGFFNRSKKQDKASSAGQHSNSEGTMALLEQALRNDGIKYEILGDEEVLDYRGNAKPYFRFETTQLFLNPACAMTNSNKQWRENQFAPGELGTIDVNIDDSFMITASASFPSKPILDADVLTRTKSQIEELVRERPAPFNGIECSDFIKVPYIWIKFGPNPGKTFDSNWLSSFIQLFVLEVHLVYGSILKTHK